MGLEDFGDKSVGSEQADLSGYDGALAPFVLVRALILTEQKGAEVSVSEAVDAELTSAHRLEQRSIFRGVGIQGSDAFAIPHYATAKLVSEVFEWDGVLR